MVVAIAPWSIVLHPGKKEVFIPQGDVQIKNAALLDVLADASGRTTVKLTYPSLATMDEDDEESENEAEATTTTVLCSLTPGKIEQAACDIIIEEGSEFVFELVGKNAINLYGNYIDQVPVDQPPMDSDMESDEDEDEDDGEEAFNLDEVSSDVEIEVDAVEADLEDDGDRFQEVEDKEMAEAEPKEQEQKSLKRPRASDVSEAEEAKLSKSQKKKLAKKIKADNGGAVPPPVQEKEKEKVADEGKKEKKQKEKGKEKAGDQQAPDKKGQSRKLEGGVEIRDAKIGTGPMAKAGDKLRVRYIGKLKDGTVFDENKDGKPFAFNLGAGQVIKGWDIGIAGMQIGGERKLIVPPSMGYGQKATPEIPANSTLIFEIKLLEIKGGKSSKK